MNIINKHILLCFILPALFISSCAGEGPEDNERFRSEVAENVSVNMSLVRAVQNLANARFYCDDRSSAPKITCTRTKDNILLYSCIQRVDLTVDPERKTIIAIMPEGIECAGF